MYGAAPQDWQRFADLGLTQDLLPVVSDPAIPVSSKSKLREDNRGKVPSFVLGDGHLAGMPGWSRNKAVPADLRKWAKDTRLGICVQTREVRAIDVDIADPAVSAGVRDLVQLTLGRLPCRSRPNSGKLLLAFRLPGTYLKRILETPHGRIEFLANGQHFVAVGTHPSGVRYEWDNYEVPSLTVDEFEAVWSMLEAQFGLPERDRARRELAEHSGAVIGLTHEDITAALAALDPNMPYDEWRSVGMALHHETQGSGLHYWQEWSAGGAEYPGDEELEYKWQSFGHYSGPPVAGGTLVKMAADAGVFIGPAAPASADEFDVVDIAAEEAKAAEAEAAKPLKYEFKPLGDLLRNRRLEWIIKGVMPKAQLAALYGQSGSGKSFFALDLAMSIARGLPWRGHRTKQTNVAYIIAEGADGFMMRVEAYARTHDITDTNTLGMRGLCAAPDLRKAPDVKELIRGVQAFGGVGLVIVDTLAQTTPGANENSSEDMSPAIKNCQAIHEATGAMVLLVHHSGKDAARGMRGWSGIRGALDAELEVAQVGRERKVTLTKSKDGRDGMEWGFALETVTLGIDEDGDEITSCVVQETAVPTAKVEKKMGPQQQLLVDAFQVLAQAQTQGIELEAVLDEAVARMDLKGKPAGKTRSNLRTALKSMLKDPGFGIGQDEDGTLFVC